MRATTSIMERALYCNGAEKVSQSGYRVNTEYLRGAIDNLYPNDQVIGVDKGFSYGTVGSVLKSGRAAANTIVMLCKSFDLDNHKLLYFPEEKVKVPKQLTIDQTISILDSLDDIYAILLKQADLLYELLMEWKGKE